MPEKCNCKPATCKGDHLQRQEGKKTRRQEFIRVKQAGKICKNQYEGGDMGAENGQIPSIREEGRKGDLEEKAEGQNIPIT